MNMKRNKGKKLEDQREKGGLRKEGRRVGKEGRRKRRKKTWKEIKEKEMSKSVKT